jgi:hypothetical protein
MMLYWLIHSPHLGMEIAYKLDRMKEDPSQSFIDLHGRIRLVTLDS